MTVAEFRALYPEFGDATAYPDASVQGWLDIAALQLRPSAWKNSLSMGIRLFVAHNLSVGGPIGGARATGGLVTDKAVGPVKVSYNVDAGLNQGAGFWNLTTYGTQFYWLMKMAGTAAVQVTGGCGRGGAGWGGPPGGGW